jgi:AraC-like DNA-binding protein
MALLIDTSVVPARDRVDYWARASRDPFHPLQIRTDSNQLFSARMWADRLGSIGVYRIAAAANTMSRTPRDIAAGDPECLHLEILLRGDLRGAQHQRMAVLKPGDMMAYDTSRPRVVRADAPFDVLVLRLAKATLGKQAAMVSRLAGVRIPGSAGVPRLAARFFFDVATGIADGTIAADDVGLEGHVIDLVQRLYTDLESYAHPTRARSRPELLLQAHAQIEARLRDPELDPAQVARGCFISTRYLHRLFENEGLTVCGFIRAARLERCRRDLLDPALAHEPIQQIASRWGFVSAPHFSRLFREAYGCSPRGFRATGTQPIMTAAANRRPMVGALSKHPEAWSRAGWARTAGSG